MLAELIAVDEILGVRDQIDRACLLKHGRSQRCDRVLPPISECLTDFGSDCIRVIKCLITEAILHAPPIVQLSDCHQAGLLR